PDFAVDLTSSQLADFIANPRGTAAALLGQATTRIIYDLDRYRATQDPLQPVYAATIVRETHVSDLPGGRESEVQVSFLYSDGFGRDIQKKIQAEPGPVPKRDTSGHIVIVDGYPIMTDHDVTPRWVGTGWTIYNNKGKPVRQYEPFFTDS